MYTAVSSVKMYACRAWIRASKAVKITVIRNDVAEPRMPMTDGLAR